MPWFYVDDGFSDSKPVMKMPDRHRLAACGLWVLAGSWSAKELTDGFVPDTKLRTLGARPSLITALTDDANLCERVSGGITFNSWAKWQKTKARVVRERKAEADKKQRWRDAKRDKEATIPSDDDDPSLTLSTRDIIDPSEPVSTRDSRSSPTTTKPSVVENGGEATVGNGAPRDPPTRYCSRHPNGTELDCGACKENRLRFEQRQNAETLAAVNTRQTALDEIHDCPECDDAGWAVDDDTDGVFKCQHPKLEARHA